jgi:hypothetical protein
MYKNLLILTGVAVLIALPAVSQAESVGTHTSPGDVSVKAGPAVRGDVDAQTSTTTTEDLDFERRRDAEDDLNSAADDDRRQQDPRLDAQFETDLNAKTNATADFNKYDSDNNGNVSSREFIRAEGSYEAETLFKDLDHNKDGTLSQREFDLHAQSANDPSAGQQASR